MVTGASRGIGRAIALALAGAGARVTLVARGVQGLHDVANDIGAMAHAMPCDLGDMASVAALAEHLRIDEGAPDILVNNAGLFPLAALDETDPALFEQTVRLNLVAPFYLLRALLPVMKAKRVGHVVTIGSVADRSVFPGNGAYCATKFGQRALHEVLLQELRGSELRSTLISPAATDTSIWDAIDPDNRHGFPKRAQMLRSADVAEAVLWAVTRPAHVNVDELRLSSS